MHALPKCPSVNFRLGIWKHYNVFHQLAPFLGPIIVVEFICSLCDVCINLHPTWRVDGFTSNPSSHQQNPVPTGGKLGFRACSVHPSYSVQPQHPRLQT